MHRLRLLVASGLVSLALIAPPPVQAGAGPPPNEVCVPGTVWEDLTSGVKYICIYDELYGGSRWELLENGRQRGTEEQPYRSSSTGCLDLFAAISGESGGGADAIVRTYRWPCTHQWDRVTQPLGELRSRIVIQRYTSGTWATCRDSGYAYNTSTAYGWVVGIDMGVGADCGSGTYRALGFGGFYQAGGWHTGGVIVPSLWLP
jgi:hypothetical protein